MKFQSRYFAKTLIIIMIFSAVSLVSVSYACECSSEPTPTETASPTPTESPTPSPTEATATPAPVASFVPVPVVNMEEDVSFNDTDLGVTLFKSVDANGQAQMDLYNVQTGTNTSTYMFSITQEDIAPYIENLPAKNTLLASGHGVSVYVLTTGEIQINAGPDKEGKIHVKIFNGIPWTQVYGYTIDPVK